MKTDDLIALMAADTKPVSKLAVTRRLAPAALLAAGIALAILILWLGMRDMGEAVGSSAYWMKTAYTIGLGAAGFLLAERLARPAGSTGRGLFALLAVLAVMLAIAVVQLATTPSGEMREALMGSTWDRCPWRIVALAIPGLLVTLVAMRRLAPTRPVLAGAGAGLFIGGISATIYGLHCAEASAAFTLIWYTAGIGLSTLAGAILGWRMLRW